MDVTPDCDYYEILQISANAETETIARVYRLLAQRYHPDNQETGDAVRFRDVHEAYGILSDPEKRAKYDVVHVQKRQERWRLVSTGANAENDFQMEQMTRLTFLEVLYTRRRESPQSPSVSPLDLQQLLGRPREHLEFTTWYLISKRFIQRADNSQLTITAEGIDHLELNYKENQQRRRLSGAVDQVLPTR
jgi:curved DNA-binding protein CbpA